MTCMRLRVRTNIQIEWLLPQQVLTSPLCYALANNSALEKKHTSLCGLFDDRIDVRDSVFQSWCEELKLHSRIPILYLFFYGGMYSCCLHVVGWNFSIQSNDNRYDFAAHAPFAQNKSGMYRVVELEYVLPSPILVQCFLSLAISQTNCHILSSNKPERSFILDSVTNSQTFKRQTCSCDENCG